jgi:NAD(P)-dependent dehydrogenase (short-subunit alcohol dehydrogenase family)
MSKTAIISGAAGGLGTKVTEKFLEAGYTVHAWTQPGKPEQVDHLKKETGDPEALHISPVDVMDGQSVKAYCSDIKDGSLQAAIFTVGGFAMGKLEDTEEEDLDKMIALNFKTAFHSVKQAMPKMAEGGRIVLISARPALDPEAAAGLLAYSLSKGMVRQLAQIVNVEGKERNVQAVTVYPSIIDTEMNREAMPDANFDHWVKPSEIADAMLYACSSEAAKQMEPELKMYGRV